MKIEKKIDKEYFEKILSGEKKFELRLADWKCCEGDILVLREVDDGRKYTGREIEKEVAYIIETKDFNCFTKDEIEKYGFQIISFN